MLVGLSNKLLIGKLFCIGDKVLPNLPYGSTRGRRSENIVLTLGDP